LDRSYFIEALTGQPMQLKHNGSLRLRAPVSPRIVAHALVTLVGRPQGVGKLLQGTPQQLGLLPQVGSEEAVGVGHGDKGGLEGVLEGLGRTGGRGVRVLDTSELEESLDGGGGNETGTTGSRDKLGVLC
jgi:hypothetical protein